ncbi:MAG: glycosyltransferase [Candidatus Moranbacteria bacterium]|nr:glycosyltransferase [Candidatus Moranbacteria bacterium]
MQKPVFYDATKRRLLLYRLTTRIFLTLLVWALVFTVGSMFRLVTFPVLSIPNAAQLRSVANVPSNVAANVLLRPDVVAAQRVVQTQKNASVDRIPKRWGFFVNWDDNSFSSLKDNIGSLDGIMPEWLHLVSADGTVIPDDMKRQEEVLTYLRVTRPGMQIVPLINNFSPDKQDWDGAALSGMLADPAARAKTIAALLDYVKRNGFAGVSIDFENVLPTSQPYLTLFMREVSVAFHGENLIVSQNIPLEDDDFNAKVLGQYADQLILMAYDEHAIGSDTAGSVAGQPWYEHALTTRLGELPADKYIVALGGYGYDWTDGGTAGNELSFQDAMRLARGSSATAALDPVTLNPTFDYSAPDGTLHHAWYLDAATVFNEIGFTSRYHPAGYAVWRLGSEDPRIWRVLRAGVTGPLNAALVDTLKIMPYGYDLDYEGKGEIVRVTGSPQAGSAEYAYDAVRNIITEENIRTYPSGYVITRYGGQNPKKIALTFDDGPDQNYTPRILSILEQFDVPAAFFVVGINASQNPELLKRIVADGSEIGNHTFTHPDITRIRNGQFQIELNALQRLFESYIFRDTLLFRPPYAEDVEPETPAQISTILTSSKFGYYTVAMHIDPSDWDQPGTDSDAIVRRVIDGAKQGDGNIVLLHDGGGNREQTVAALPGIITGLRDAGFELVSVSSLLGVDRDSVMPSVSSTGRFAIAVNGFSFGFIDRIGDVMSFFFFIGIVFGLSRLCFIVALAIIQKFKGFFVPKRRFRADFRPAVSVIIPAFNEERVIVQTIESILKSDYPTFDVIVVDDGSTDGTWNVIRERFADHPSIRLFTRENGGKSSSLNFGISQTSAPILVTLDSDTQFQSDTISKLARHFADPRIGAVAGNSKVGNRINVLTRWQALEYIVGQNLDRRAFEVLNAITVVPGSVGAWRSEAVERAGGFSSRTLAEDADLTFGIIRNGYRVVYEDDAYGFTEAPDNVRDFLKQRFRWMYGTIQTVYQHRGIFLNVRKGGSLGFVAMPNVLLFQILFPLVSPLIDLALITSLLWGLIQNLQHPIDYSVAFGPTLEFYYFFSIVDIAIAVIAFLLEKRREQWSLILWLPLQRFFYRQLMYYVAFKTITTVIKGREVRWGEQDRQATVSLGNIGRP